MNTPTTSPGLRLAAVNGQLLDRPILYTATRPTNSAAHQAAHQAARRDAELDYATGNAESDFRDEIDAITRRHNLQAPGIAQALLQLAHGAYLYGHIDAATSPRGGDAS